MYVIRASNGDQYPADQCRWRTFYDEDDGQYKIAAVEKDSGGPVFYDGATVGGIIIPGGASDSTRAVLGYIAKTGRFVPITSGAA